jgi:hypothetical protein
MTIHVTNLNDAQATSIDTRYDAGTGFDDKSGSLYKNTSNEYVIDTCGDNFTSFKADFLKFYSVPKRLTMIRDKVPAIHEVYTYLETAPTCDGSTPPPPIPENQVDDGCIDGIDNDSNGQTDCDDASCAVDIICNLPETENEIENGCIDGFDNDLDKKADCEDTDCVSEEACITPPATESEVDGGCEDMIDNDKDDVIDCDDSDCEDLEICTDGTTGTDPIQDKPYSGLKFDYFVSGFGGDPKDTASYDTMLSTEFNGMAKLLMLDTASDGLVTHEGAEATVAETLAPIATILYGDPENWSFDEWWSDGDSETQGFGGSFAQGFDPDNVYYERILGLAQGNEDDAILDLVDGDEAKLVTIKETLSAFIKYHQKNVINFKFEFTKDKDEIPVSYNVVGNMLQTGEIALKVYRKSDGVEIGTFTASTTSPQNVDSIKSKIVREAVVTYQAALQEFDPTFYPGADFEMHKIQANFNSAVIIATEAAEGE